MVRDIVCYYYYFGLESKKAISNSICQNFKKKMVILLKIGKSHVEVLGIVPSFSGKPDR
jgi:hypothetical protein